MTLLEDSVLNILSSDSANIFTSFSRFMILTIFTSSAGTILKEIMADLLPIGHSKLKKATLYSYIICE